MEVFDNVAPFTNKVNFVDYNNVFVGFDMAQNCCEKARWYIENGTDDLDGYFFDITYFEQSFNDSVSRETPCNIAKFRLISFDKDKPPRILTLENTHNGYYAHGFNMIKNYKTIHEGRV